MSVGATCVYAEFYYKRTARKLMYVQRFIANSIYECTQSGRNVTSAASDRDAVL